MNVFVVAMWFCSWSLAFCVYIMMNLSMCLKISDCCTGFDSVINIIKIFISCSVFFPFAAQLYIVFKRYICETKFE